MLHRGFFYRISPKQFTGPCKTLCPCPRHGRTRILSSMESTTVRGRQVHVVVQTTVNHPIDAVFPYLSHPSTWHDFAPAVEFRRQIDGGPPRVGTRWMSTDRIGPFRAHFIDRLEALDENQRVVWWSSAPWNARVEYACEEASAGTRIRADYLGEPSDSLRWQVGWIPDWAWHLILAQDFRRLDRLLTRRARSASRWELHHTSQPLLG